MTSPSADTSGGRRAWALAALTMWLIVVIAGLLAAARQGTPALVAAVVVASMSGLAMHAAWRSSRQEDDR